MSEFYKWWIIASCAPESIVVVRESPIGALLRIQDESEQLQVCIVEHFKSGTIVGIGDTYAECCTPVSYSFSEAAHLICEKLGVSHYPL